MIIKRAIRYNAELVESRNIYKPLSIMFSMAEKESAKKWLALLVVLVALSLVIDLLSLNVLYGINNTASSGSGELAASPYRSCFDGCMDGAQYDCVYDCTYGTSSECYCCEWNVEESCRTGCGKSSRNKPTQCQ